MKDNDYSDHFNPYNLDFSEAIQRIKNYSAKEDNSLGYTLPVLIDTPIPYRDPGDIREYQRYNGNHKMIMQSPREFGYPFGGKSRLILIWLISTCMKNYYKGRASGMEQTDLNRHSRMIYHGSIKEILDKLGYQHHSGGENGEITLIKKHFEAVLNASFNHLPSQQADHTTRGFGRFFISHREKIRWPGYFDENKKAKEDSFIQLNADLYENMSRKVEGYTPRPIDLRVLGAFKDWPMAMDLYCWLCKEVYDILYKNKWKSRWYSWDSLQPQFGDNYSKTWVFARDAKKALKQIALIWKDRTFKRDGEVILQGLKYDTPRGRLVLHASPLHVKRHYKNY